MLVALPLLLTLPLASAGDHGVVVDIRHAEGAHVQALKQASGVRWWLELGDRLLLAGDRVALDIAVPATEKLGEIDQITPQQLALRARGCKEHADAPGTLLARGGRWELRRLAAHESMPTSQEHTDEWRPVETNSVFAHQYRLDAPAAAAADPGVQPIVDAVNAGRWFADVQALAGWDRSSYGTTSLNAARDWIASRFGSFGLSPATPTFSMPGSGGSGTISRHNVVGRWNGTTRPDEWIVVGGHYDSRNTSLASTVNAPGADDNASGCAGVIELARVLVSFRPQRSVLFLCYAGEEQGLYGSKAHVQSLQQSGDFSKVKSVIIMDMIAYSADNQLDALFESSAAHSTYLQRFAAAAATYVPDLNVTLSTNPFGSDHVPYLNAGKETLLAIETDYDIYPHYHKSTDLPQNMGPHALALGSSILRTNAAMLADLTGASDRIFADDSETVP